jgi:hypothetical protein
VRLRLCVMALRFRAPASGDRILVMRRAWLDLVLSGEKTMEIRAMPLRKGATYFLGCKGHVYGSVVVAEVQRLDSDEEWRGLLQSHLWDRADLPYKRTFAHSLLNLAASAVPVPYKHPRGAIGLVLFKC